MAACYQQQAFMQAAKLGKPHRAMQVAAMVTAATAGAKAHCKGSGRRTISCGEADEEVITIPGGHWGERVAGWVHRIAARCDAKGKYPLSLLQTMTRLKGLSLLVAHLLLGPRHLCRMSHDQQGMPRMSRSLTLLVSA